MEDILIESQTRYPVAVDVGCGPEVMSTVFLAPYFDKVLGSHYSLKPFHRRQLCNTNTSGYSITLVEL
ncbi:hypothetical protein EB796_006064 [Bugula neritina]|uniref:Uncharacterized protein n=1 Tax=Bugula neritina TaxID=10212 RepID=A0A7J7KCF6_BUGNE|nr:hypothetical protein EB796_006064 [Bugula neritina]